MAPGTLYIYINPTAYYARGTAMSNCSFAISAAFTNLTDALEFDLVMMWAEIRRTHQAFLKSLATTKPLSSLPILMRAVNAVRSRFVIRQPCWRSARWRST